MGGILWSYEQPVSNLAKCSRCGFESAAAMMNEGLCSGCVIMKGEKSKAFALRSLESTVTTHAVRARCYARMGRVPKEILAFCRGKESVLERELPEELRWVVEKKRTPRKGPPRQPQAQRPGGS